MPLAAVSWKRSNRIRSLRPWHKRRCLEGNYVFHSSIAHALKCSREESFTSVSFKVLVFSLSGFTYIGLLYLLFAYCATGPGSAHSPWSGQLCGLFWWWRATTEIDILIQGLVFPIPLHSLHFRALELEPSRSASSAFCFSQGRCRLGLEFA